MFCQELRLIAGVGVVDGGLQGSLGRVHALGQVAVLDRPEDRLDLVELGAVGRQEIEVDAVGPQRGQRLAYDAAMMQAGIVQHHHERHGAGRPLQQEVHQVRRREGPGRADPVKGRLHAVRGVERQGVVAAPLGVLIGHILALAGADPAHRHRETGAEAALIEEDALKQPRGRPFPSIASTPLARSTWAGSCWWRSERTVRRHLAPMPWRSRRVCRVLSRMPAAGSAWASCAAVQVRGWSNNRSRAVVTCSRRAVSGGGPGRWCRSPARPWAVYALSAARTVAAWYPRCWAMAG